MSPADQLLTVKQVADWLQVDQETVRRLARAGDLASYRVGREYRFTWTQVTSYLSGQNRGQGSEDPGPPPEGG